MLEAFGLVVSFPPFHAEHFREHALDEVMAQREAASDLASFRGEADFAAGFDANQAIFLEAAQGPSSQRARGPADVPGAQR